MERGGEEESLSFLTEREEDGESRLGERRGLFAGRFLMEEGSFERRFLLGGEEGGEERGGFPIPSPAEHFICHKVLWIVTGRVLRHSAVSPDTVHSSFFFVLEDEFLESHLAHLLLDRHRLQVAAATTGLGSGVALCPPITLSLQIVQRSHKILRWQNGEL